MQRVHDVIVFDGITCGGNEIFTIVGCPYQDNASGAVCSYNGYDIVRIVADVRPRCFAVRLVAYLVYYVGTVTVFGCYLLKQVDRFVFVGVGIGILEYVPVDDNVHIGLDRIVNGPLCHLKAVLLVPDILVGIDRNADQIGIPVLGYLHENVIIDEFGKPRDSVQTDSVQDDLVSGRIAEVRRIYMKLSVHGRPCKDGISSLGINIGV